LNLKNLDFKNRNFKKVQRIEMQELNDFLDSHFPYWNEIEPFLFLGSVEALHDESFMKNIDAVVSITMIPTEEFNLSPRIHHLDICLEDRKGEPIHEYFKVSHDFIRKHITDAHRVFVHCAAGISRSATLVTAFLMMEYKCSTLEALKMVKIKRHIINPNEGFLKQLLQLEKELK